MLQKSWEELNSFFLKAYIEIAAARGNYLAGKKKDKIKSFRSGIYLNAQ